MKQMGHGFLMTLFISVWDSPDFYIHCGFEVKKLVEMLTPALFLYHSSQLHKKERGGSQPRKKKTSNISLFLLAFVVDFHSMF